MVLLNDFHQSASHRTWVHKSNAAAMETPPWHLISGGDTSNAKRPKCPGGVVHGKRYVMHAPLTALDCPCRPAFRIRRAYKFQSNLACYHPKDIQPQLGVRVRTADLEAEKVSEHVSDGLKVTGEDADVIKSMRTDNRLADDSTLPCGS